MLPAQNHTVKGRITDASSREPLPFVHVVVAGTQLGVVSDIDGHFAILCPDTAQWLEFSTMGYEPRRMPSTKSNNLKVQLRPSANNLKEVTVKGKRNRQRYRRKDNPAVELFQEVVAHKELNRMEHFPYYHRQNYSKINVALDEFHPNFKRHPLWKHLPFAEEYIDVTCFDNSEVLHIMITEDLIDEHHRNPEVLSRYLTTAKRQDGLGAAFDSEGADPGEDGLADNPDIYQNEIDIMGEKFISPLSSIANASYHYYITDTLLIDSMPCVELTFKPVNKSDNAFVGRMYVATADSSYAVRRCEMEVSELANINWLHKIHLLMDYQRDSLGSYLPSRSDIYCRVGPNVPIKLLKKIYLQSTNVYYDYSFVDTVRHFPDSLFGFASNYASLPSAQKVKRAEWNELRPIALSYPELFLDSFRFELMRTPFMRHTVHAAMILATGYIPTSGDRDSSKFDIGNLWNCYSVNALEGTRLRLGGMTKAQLHPRNFADGYLAYGTSDQRFKFGLNLTRTFDDKKKHANEYPHNSIALMLRYDVESPGVSYGLFSHDNILMTSTSRMMEYVGSAQLRLQKQWGTALNLNTSLSAEDHQPTGTLSYNRLLADGSWQPVGHYNTLEWSTQLSLVPNQKVNNTRNSGALTSQKRNALSLSLGHNMGWFEGFYYNSTTLNAHKILWLTPLGYMDLRLDAGKVWNQVPLPKLFFPSGTSSQFLIQGAFNDLSPMEFAADQYLAFFANYHLRGLILNHIPVVRRLKWREVASFALYWGSLSDRNDPDSGHAGLYQMPAHTQRLGALPYMEYSVGIENILHLIRIDYVCRLTYLQESKSFADHLRIGLEFSL